MKEGMEWLDTGAGTNGWAVIQSCCTGAEMEPSGDRPPKPSAWILARAEGERGSKLGGLGGDVASGRTTGSGGEF